MAVGPEIAVHQGIEIRYGYDIVSDKFIAHITVPESKRPGRAHVRSAMRRALPGHSYSMQDSILEHLLDSMKDAIDEFLDA
ncbi:hypothetical protein [Dyella sp. 2HG41-7]|uniref:hypothetical protein n=1 Tax=Dyella sp. 2HG41-7 TaxID=2883239 RepID=UPI001F20FEA7|nr:hypothetical protein [Dyella sp. 2HG41-7]